MASAGTTEDVAGPEVRVDKRSQACGGFRHAFRHPSQVDPADPRDCPTCGADGRIAILGEVRSLGAQLGRSIAAATGDEPAYSWPIGSQDDHRTARVAPRSVSVDPHLLADAGDDAPRDDWARSRPTLRVTQQPHLISEMDRVVRIYETEPIRHPRQVGEQGNVCFPARENADLTRTAVP